MKRIILRLSIAIITLTAIVLLSYKTVLSARMHTEPVQVIVENPDLLYKALTVDAVAGGSASLGPLRVLIARTGR